MRLIFLGTSGAQPTKTRGLSCVCLEREGEILMFDAGEGAQTAYLKSKLGWNRPMKIFITHMHGDHCIGLLGLLQTMTLQKRTKGIEIFGPVGIDDFVATNARILNFGLPFPITITAVSDGRVSEEKSYTIRACRASHSILAYSYLFEEKDKPGRFNREKARKLGIPEGSMWGQLQKGNSVTVNGKTVRSSEILGAGRPGKRIGISGDTRPTEELEEFFRDCDYLVFDSTFADQLVQKALETFHSTAKEAATLARKANVTNLVLTHFSARYRDESALLQEAGSIHRSVMAARDLLEIEIK